VKPRPIALDGATLSLEQLAAIADGHPCKLASGVRGRIRASRKLIDRAVRGGDAVYGVNTGFGELAHVRVDDHHLGRLQQNLIRSHSAGVGPPLPERTVRAILALRANCLARGHSGIRLETVQSIVDLLEAGLHPVVPSQGSVGASGDLAPLAHIALALTGEGDVFYRGKRVAAADALRRARLRPVRLEAKEGLALINGTQMMTAIGALTLLRAERLAATADLVGAMTLEALMGSHQPFAPLVHGARPQRGQSASARNLRRLLRDSEIERAHIDCGRVQDCYSLRCIPQVHGAVRDTLTHVRRVLEIEINSSTDNPMVFAERGRIISAGNFHGQPVSLALDHLTTAVCSFGTISERRIDRLLDTKRSGLPAFLADDPGLNSGFMLAHVTAAALVSENKILAHPASVDTVPTSAGTEDHVSMGAHASRKAEQVVQHVATVLAIELICAAQGLDLRKPLRPGRGVDAARRAVRRKIRRFRDDRVMSEEIQRALALIDGDELRRCVEAEAGELA